MIRVECVDANTGRVTHRQIHWNVLSVVTTSGVTDSLASSFPPIARCVCSLAFLSSLNITWFVASAPGYQCGCGCRALFRIHWENDDIEPGGRVSYSFSR